MKRHLLGILATGIVFITAMPAAQAATTPYSPTHIYLDGQAVTNPVHTTAVDPSSHQETTFMPIYYAMQILKDLGITSNWDGHTWSLTVPNSMNPNLSNPSNSPNQLTIAINGTVVQSAPKVVAIDPASGKETTFIPIFYLSQVLNRLGVHSTWDGTNWRLIKTTPEAQTAMANAMWATFAPVTFDINSHPSMSQVGISPTASPVTAGDVANWLAQWAAKAKGVTIAQTGKPTQYVSYSLKYEASTDPYTWAADNQLFQGTSVSSTSSSISTTDAQTILSNLRWWLTGDKVVNGVNYLHVPFYSNYELWSAETIGNKVSQTQYQSTLADVAKYYDKITAKVNGSIIDLTLPNTSQSASDIGWMVTDGNYEFGGWQAKDNHGGTTIQVSNAGPGVNISESTLIPNLYLEGCTIVYFNVHGTPDFTHPYNALLGQPLP